MKAGGKRQVTSPEPSLSLNFSPFPPPQPPGSLILSSGPWALPRVRGGHALFCGLCKQQEPLATENKAKPSLMKSRGFFPRCLPRDSCQEGSPLQCPGIGLRGFLCPDSCCSGMDRRALAKGRAFLLSELLSSPVAGKFSGLGGLTSPWQLPGFQNLPS